jgi:hypothetical protein
MAAESQHVYSSFSLCPKKTSSGERMAHPDGQWPPATIPSECRVHRTADLDSQPEHLDQVSESAFRIRKWAHFGMGIQIFPVGSAHRTMSTYGTLDPKLYTPTKKKPYQGIWVGDYSDQGCEFLLFFQPDSSVGADCVPVPQSTASIYPFHRPPQTDPGIQGSSSDQNTEYGRLEAIKLTGDPNVPRGEIAFFAEDIGPGGMVRIADENTFRGARIVRSQIHVASRNFRDGMSPPPHFPFLSFSWARLKHWFLAMSDRDIVNPPQTDSFHLN